MRHEPTDAEKKLWSRLRDRRLGGFKFRRQVPLGGYIVDFFCDERNVAVELDGGQHNDPVGASRDAGRDEALRELGVQVLRFWDPDVLKETGSVCEAIVDALTARASDTPSPLPSPGGRGRLGAGSSRGGESSEHHPPSPSGRGRGKGVR